MKEAASGRIQVQDVGSGAVERMLNFVYTGKLFPTDEKEPVTDELIIELLHCADKYGIAEMKEYVLALMRSNLSTRNALKFAQTAKLIQNRLHLGSVSVGSKSFVVSAAINPVSPPAVGHCISNVAAGFNGLHYSGAQ